MNRHRFPVYSVIIIFLLSINSSLNAQNSVQQAMQYYKAGNYKEALVAFEQLINGGQATKEIFYGAIDCAVRLKLNDKSIQIIEKAEKKFGIQYEWTFLLGQLYAQGGQLTQAVTVLQKVRKSFPDSSEVRFYLADVYANLGAKQFTDNKFEEAYISLKEAYKNNPQKKDYTRNYLVVCIRLKKFNEALPLAKEVFLSSKSDIEIGKLYFQLLLQTEKYKDALRVVQVIAKAFPDNTDVLLDVALAYRYTSEYDSATAYYQKLRQSFPRSREVYKAELDWLMASGLKDTVISRCREFLLNTPDDKEIMTIMAQQYQRKKSFDTARTIYREMRAKDLDRDAALKIAECYLQEYQKDSAIIELNEYAVTGGKNADGFLTLYGLLFKANRIAELKKILLIGIKRFREYADFNLLMAKQYLFEDAPDSAFLYLEPIKGVYSRYPEISYITARLYDSKADTAKAVFHYSRFIRVSMAQSQNLQTQISTTISGDGMMNPDSLDKAEKAGSELDTLTSQLRAGFDRLRIINGRESYGKLLDELIADIPQGVPIYIARAKYRLELGDSSAAANDIETALRISAYNEEVQKETGNFYYETGDYEKAFIAYRAALSKNNKVKLYYERIIELSIKLKRTDEVIEFWKRRYESNPENELLRESLIELLHKTERFEEAAKYSQE